jgi:4-diphosphocytidyl-2-C-methyl-D-erythritol kinase
MDSELVVRCRAKINLTLDVLDRRADGFHDIKSVMQSIDLSDTLQIRRTEGNSVEVTSSDPGIPSGPGNTVYDAAMLFKNAANIIDGMNMRIEKRIPHQAGLGGGSSDAAGALVGLNRLFSSPLSQDELAKLAAKIGSDVPYFLVGGTAAIGGRGDVVAKLPDAPVLELVVIKPEVGVSTPWAYGRLDEISHRKSKAASGMMITAVQDGNREQIVRNLSNDFEEVVVAGLPEIAEAKRDMIELGAEQTLLCGSGAAVFGVFGEVVEAEKASKILRKKYHFMAVARTTPVAITIEESGSEG